MKKLPLAFLLLLTACGGSSRPAPDLYTLRADGISAQTCRNPGTIKIYEPVAGSGLDSARIAVRDGGKDTFYQSVRWNAATPRMLQLYLADAFERSGLFSTVLTDDSPSKTTWILESQMRDFHIEKQGGTSMLSIRLTATLINAQTRKPIRSIPLEARRDVSGLKMAAIVDTYSQEMNVLTTQLLQKIRGRVGC